jgi:hypothetical protein
MNNLVKHGEFQSIIFKTGKIKLISLEIKTIHIFKLNK